MTDAHGIARAQLRAFVERIERLEEEKKTIADDIRDVYGEAKSFGFDTVILKRVIALRKKDEQQRTEEEMILDTYLQALGMIPAFERQEVKPAVKDETDHETTAKLVATVATGMQTEIGRKALVTALDILIEREEAEEFQAKASGDNGATVQDDEETADSMTGDASRPSRGGDTPASFPEPDQPLTGGDHVTDPHFAATNRTGGLVSKPPAKHLLKPHCLNRELCRSGTTDHCFSCKKAMASGELETA